jgi:dihydroneopterin aldolase
VSDAILLSGLRAVGAIGVLPEEQARAQPFEIDLALRLDLRTAGTSDDLADTIDYGSLAERVVALVTTGGDALLERVAQRIAFLVLEDRRVDEVEVTVRKLRPPIPVDVVCSAVTVVRGRDDV